MRDVLAANTATPRVKASASRRTTWTRSCRPISKAALLLSSGSAGTGEGAVTTYKAAMGYMGIEDCGVCWLFGEDNKSEAKMAEIKAWAKGL